MIIMCNPFIGDLNLKIRDYIGTKLKETKKVVLYKTEQREGLIRARIFGARRASGQVSHCIMNSTK